jgi:hypothetical protein
MGDCSILSSPSNPITGACVEMVLVLKDADGKDVLKTRTDKDGKFQFTIASGYPFTIETGSKAFEVVDPKSKLYPGKIQLQIRQK